MDNVYNDLENYDDVDAVNKLTAENAELKHKLEGCNRIIKKLQEDFDNLEAEFKQLEKNYSSLLKISRAEIQRKTELITSLNIEKDLLVIKAVQNGPAHKVQKLLKTVRDGTEVQKKKKVRDKVDGPKGRQEILRRKSDLPLSPASSTTTTTTTADSSNKFTGSQKVTDKNKPNRTVTKENDSQNNRDTLFPDNRPSSPVTDKRVSALSRPRLAKLSSDEEFEDMYTALKPKPSREPDRNRKKSLDDAQDGKVLNSNLYSQPYSDSFRDRFSKNKSGRFSDNERNMNRDKHHNERDRSTNRAKQYNNDKSRNASDLQYKRVSPERHRRGPREVGYDRYRSRHLESPPRGQQRLESPERQKHQFKKICKRRKSYHGRDREHRDSDGIGYPETTIHGAYGEPLNKKPRMEPYAVQQDEKIPNEKQLNIVNQDEKQLKLDHQDEKMPNEKQLDLDHQDEKMPNEKQLDLDHQDEKMPNEKQLNHVHQDEEMPNDKQCHKDSRPPNMDSRTCQTPDFSHTEESSNEPVTAHSDGSTASAVFNDPRRNSKLYVKCTAGSGDVLQSANSTEIYLQPVNKTLWNLQEVEVPKALGSKPAEISEELVDNMDIDKNIAVASLESGEIRSEMKDTPLDDNYDYQEFNQQNYNDDSNVIESLKKKDKHHKENSLVDNSMPQDIRNEGSLVNNEFRKQKSPKVNNRRTGELSTPTCKNSHEVDTKARHDNAQIPSILQKLILSMNEKIPDHDSTDKVSNNKQEKESKQVAESKISNQTEKAGSKNKNINKLELNKPEKSEKITSTKKEKDPKHFSEMIVSNNPEKAGLRTRDKIKNKNVSILKSTHELDKETENNKEKELEKVGVSKSLDKNKKTTIKSIDDVDPKNVSELRTSNNPDKVTKNNLEKHPKRNGESRISVRTENTSSKAREVDHKYASKVNTKNKHETEAENNVTIFREFEHRVYSRHIVEGDLELSDESNDETQVKIGDKIEDPKIKISNKKYHRDTYKDKKVNSEDITRKTRSQKDKVQERKSVDKFSELFGDSSSLITPEDLNLATRTAHGLPADCCPPAAEDARDTIIETEIPLETQRTKVNHKVDFKNNLVEPSVFDTNTNPNKHKPKKSTIRAKNKQNNDLESEIVSNTHKDVSKQVHSEVTKHAGLITEGISVSEENQVPFNDQLKQVQKAKINGINENDAKLIEQSKDYLKSNKRPKTKGEKKEDTNSNKTYNSSEPNLNNTLTMNDNKENTSRNFNSEGNISNEMSRIFENTIVPSKTTSDVSEINKETPQLKESTSETFCSSAGVEDVPNLRPVVEEPGLVKMVVISTGVQPPDSKSIQYPTPFNALASSTPAKDLCTVNISSEMEPKVNHTAQVSVTISRNDSVSQPEADVPDMRITCYRRRRKVLKR